MIKFTEHEARELYREARSRGGEAGFYNRNVSIDSAYGPVVVRTPLDAAPRMDLVAFPEAAVLDALAGHLSNIPTVLFSTSSPTFSILSECPGIVVDKLYPKDAPLPSNVIEGIRRHIQQLFEAPVPKDLRPSPRWPDEGDCQGVFERLVEVTRAVQESRSILDLETCEMLGLDEHLLDRAVLGEPIQPRQFRWVHSDIHRKNLMVSGNVVSLIDWELALVGDPVYELAVHIHKMGYTEAQCRELLLWWSESVGIFCEPWRADLDTYLRHERVKSAFVDSIRYTRVVALDNRAVDPLAKSLERKVALARQSAGYAALPSDVDIKNVLLSQAAKIDVRALGERTDEED